MNMLLKRIALPAVAVGALLLAGSTMSFATDPSPQERCLQSTYETSGMATLAKVRATPPVGATSIVEVVTGVLPLPDGDSPTLCEGVEGTVVHFDNGTSMLLPEGAQQVRLDGEFIVAEFDEPLAPSGQ